MTIAPSSPPAAAAFPEAAAPPSTRPAIPPSRPGADPGPFAVFKFKTTDPGKATIDRDGKHFLSDISAEDADALAEILNAAVKLAGRPELVTATATDNAKFARFRIAVAVARALGGEVDVDSFLGQS